MESRIKTKLNYSFDGQNNLWYKGKKQVEEEEILISFIRFAKSKNIPNAGEYAEKELAKAKQEPIYTTRIFAKSSIIRNRNKRIAGKFLFAEWCRAVGIEIIGKLEDFMVRNSLLVNRFYIELCSIHPHFRRQARIIGKVCNSVFFGIDLKTDPEIPSKTVKKHKSIESPKNDALRRYNEFMMNLFRSNPK